MSKTFTKWLSEKNSLNEAIANFTKEIDVEAIEAFLTGHFSRNTNDALAYTFITKNAKSGAVALFNQKTGKLKPLNASDAKIVDKLIQAGMAEFIKTANPTLKNKHGSDWNTLFSLNTKGGSLLQSLKKK